MLLISIDILYGIITSELASKHGYDSYRKSDVNNSCNDDSLVMEENGLAHIDSAATSSASVATFTTCLLTVSDIFLSAYIILL